MSPNSRGGKAKTITANNNNNNNNKKTPLAVCPTMELSARVAV